MGTFSKIELPYFVQPVRGLRGKGKRKGKEQSACPKKLIIRAKDRQSISYTDKDKAMTLADSISGDWSSDCDETAYLSELQDDKQTDPNNTPTDTTTLHIVAPMSSISTNNAWPQTIYDLSQPQGVGPHGTFCTCSYCSSQYGQNKEESWGVDGIWSIAQTAQSLEPISCYTHSPVDANNQVGDSWKEPYMTPARSPFNPVDHVPGPAFPNLSKTVSNGFQDITNGLMPHLVSPEPTMCQRAPYWEYGV